MSSSVDTSGVEDLLRQHAVERLGLGAEAFVAAAQGRCSRRTGALADSVHVAEAAAVDGDVVRATVTAGEGLDYARFQDEGTGLYGPEGTPIVPVNANFLVFDSAAGGLTFAKSVAGSPGTHFWADTVDDWPNIIGTV